MKDHLDWIEVRGILQQIAQACADCLDGVFDAKDFVGGKVVHHHNVSALERRSQTLLEVGQKDFAVHCSVDQHRRDYSGETQARNKGHGLPVAQWHISDQALPGRSVRFPALHPSNRRTRADLQLFGGLTPRRSRLHKSNDSHSHLTGIRSAHGPPPGESMRIESVPGRPLGIPDSPRPENPLVQLNDREVETLTWVARGKTSAEIAQILGLTKRTVDFHIDNARTKLGAATRTQAVIKAATGRVIEP